MDWTSPTGLLVMFFIATQVVYALTFVIDAYLFTRPVDRVNVDELRQAAGEMPFIVLLYPVLRELETTMRTTFSAIGQLNYPRHRFQVVAVPNSNDADTIASLERLRAEFPFLDVHVTPPTKDASWNRVWSAWEENPKAYWWHQGRRARQTDLPPKKTRQLIHAFYAIAEQRRDTADFLINYIDADSVPAPDHFLAGAAGMQHFDVVQAQNIAGNLNASLAASWHAFDHMAWDGSKYPHLSAGGNHPYWVLGKGLFFRASDLVELGGFHPWITIEDPEVGMRFWKNGRRLGIIETPLIEEVPESFGRGVTQRKRWVCGFFQSLGEPLDRMGFTPVEKFKAWLNFLPCLSLWVNAVGLPVGIWALIEWRKGSDVMPQWVVWLAAANIAAYVLSLLALYVSTWRRTAIVLDRKRDRLGYMLRVNPLFLMIWWVMWLVPLALGLIMYLRDDGLVWERTEKVNANKTLIATRLKQSAT